MKIGNWRVDFKTTITGKYKNIKDVPFWSAYIVRRERKYLVNKDTGELICTTIGQVKYEKLPTRTLDELKRYIRTLLPIYGHYYTVWDADHNATCERVGPSSGGYIVAYPRKSRFVKPWQSHVSDEHRNIVFIKR